MTQRASKIRSRSIAAYAEFPDIDLMTEADLDAVAELEVASQAFPWSRALFADSLSGGHAAWVARKKGVICGFMIVMVVLDEAHLLNFAVRPRGRGLGGHLLRFGLDWAVRAGVRRVFLEVRLSNEDAQALYRRMGFSEIGRRADYYPAHEGREDGLVFSRGLEDFYA